MKTLIITIAGIRHHLPGSSMSSTRTALSRWKDNGFVIPDDSEPNVYHKSSPLRKDID